MSRPSALWLQLFVAEPHIDGAIRVEADLLLNQNHVEAGDFLDPGESPIGTRVF
jgi:hypothetical protein